MENMDKNKMVEVRCSECGELIANVTAECFESIDASEDVQTIFLGYKLVATHNGKIYCRHCADEQFEWCEHCESWSEEGTTAIHTSAYRPDSNVEYWCDACKADDAFYCDDCQRWFDDDVAHHYVENDDTTICDRCFDYCNYYRCVDCGNVFSGHPTIIDGDYYCDDCYEKSRPVIYEYHRYPDDWEFRYDVQKHRETSSVNLIRTQVPFIGVELEIEDGGTDDSNAIDITTALGYAADQSTEFKCAEDGSLSYGFEIISMPASYDWHINHYDWEAGMNKALNLGYRSHDGGNCGIHFHIDRKHFEGSMVKPERAFVIIVANNENWLRIFSRREDYEYCEFRRDGVRFAPDDFKAENSNSTNDTIYRLINYYSGHHRAINFDPYSTIEVRFIRGTLKYSTFKASMQLMVMLAYAVKHFREQQLANVDLNWFKRYAKRLGFTEFLAYLDERGIMA